MMKKILIVGFISFLSFYNAQNKQIVFEPGNFASVLKKAEKEHKLIFIDAYTTWCGPCKKMAKDIFTLDTVANYYNSTFINYKFDMEKGEGIEFAKKYQVNCYPNLLILDCKGNIVHRTAGYMSGSEFIAFAKNSLSTDKNFIALKTSYEKTGLTEQTLSAYIQLMEGACLSPSKGVTSYLKTVKDENLINETNWNLIRDIVTDVNSREINYLIKNYQEFELKYNKAVETKIINTGTLFFSEYLNAKEFDKNAYEKSKLNFLKLNWPYNNLIIYNTELKLNKKFNKPAYYESVSQPQFLRLNYDNAEALNSMAWSFYEDVNDKKQLEAAVLLAKRAVEIENNYMCLDTYAAVLYKAGHFEEAETEAIKAIETAKKENLTPEDYKETSELLLKIKAKLKG